MGSVPALSLGMQTVVDRDLSLLVFDQSCSLYLQGGENQQGLAPTKLINKAFLGLSLLWQSLWCLPLLFSYSFILGCMAARTALNTQNTVPGLHGWDCPCRGVSWQPLCMELHFWEGSEPCLELCEGPCGASHSGLRHCLW